MEISEIVEEILAAAPGKEVAIIIVGGDGEVQAPEGEELMEPDDQDDVDEEMTAFMEAYFDSIFGGSRGVAGGGGVQDAILMDNPGQS